jgi:hypothetical protein
MAGRTGAGKSLRLGRSSPSTEMGCSATDRARAAELAAVPSRPLSGRPCLKKTEVAPRDPGPAGPEQRDGCARIRLAGESAGFKGSRDEMDPWSSWRHVLGCERPWSPRHVLGYGWPWSSRHVLGYSELSRCGGKARSQARPVPGSRRRRPSVPETISRDGGGAGPAASSTGRAPLVSKHLGRHRGRGPVRAAGPAPPPSARASPRFPRGPAGPCDYLRGDPRPPITRPARRTCAAAAR